MKCFKDKMITTYGNVFDSGGCHTADKVRDIDSGPTIQEQEKIFEEGLNFLLTDNFHFLSKYIESITIKSINVSTFELILTKKEKDGAVEPSFEITIDAGSKGSWTVPTILKSIKEITIPKSKDKTIPKSKEKNKEEVPFNDKLLDIFHKSILDNLFGGIASDEYYKFITIFKWFIKRGGDGGITYECFNLRGNINVVGAASSKPGGGRKGGMFDDKYSKFSGGLCKNSENKRTNTNTLCTDDIYAGVNILLLNNPKINPFCISSTNTGVRKQMPLCNVVIGTSHSHKDTKNSKIDTVNKVLKEGKKVICCHSLYMFKNCSLKVLLETNIFTKDSTQGIFNWDIIDMGQLGYYVVLLPQLQAAAAATATPPQKKLPFNINQLVLYVSNDQSERSVDVSQANPLTDEEAKRNQVSYLEIQRGYDLVRDICNLYDGNKSDTAYTKAKKMQSEIIQAFQEWLSKASIVSPGDLKQSSRALAAKSFDSSLTSVYHHVGVMNVVQDQKKYKGKGDNTFEWLSNITEIFEKKINAYKFLDILLSKFENKIPEINKYLDGLIKMYKMLKAKTTATQQITDLIKHLRITINVLLLYMLIYTKRFCKDFVSPIPPASQQANVKILSNFDDFDNSRGIIGLMYYFIFIMTNFKDLHIERYSSISIIKFAKEIGALNTFFNQYINHAKEVIKNIFLNSHLDDRLDLINKYLIFISDVSDVSDDSHIYLPKTDNPDDIFDTIKEVKRQVSIITYGGKNLSIPEIEHLMSGIFKGQSNFWTILLKGQVTIADFHEGEHGFVIKRKAEYILFRSDRF